MTDQQQNGIDAERALLSCLIQTPSLIGDVDLTPDAFGAENHQEIYRAITGMDAANVAIDAITVADELKRETGRDWLPIVGRIAADFAPESLLPSYVRIVKSEFMRRRAHEVASELMAAGDIESGIDSAVSELMALSASVHRRTEWTMKDAMRAAVEEIERTFERKGLPGVSTGITGLDDALGGLHESDLIVIGARPSIGKTALALNMADKCEVSCGIISSEQGVAQVAMRFMAMNSRVSVQKIRRAKLDDLAFQRITRAVEHYSDKTILISDDPVASYLDVIRMARKWKHNHGIEILFVDYLQRIKHPDSRKPRHEQVAEMVQAFKELARSLNIPVVLLSQVVRGVDERANKRPGMGDLANSSEIEREADQIITMYRDAVYNQNTDSPDVAELIICKNRHGETMTIPVHWSGEFMRFSDLDNRYEPEYAEASAW